MQTFFLDTETTGLTADDRIVELAIVHESGQIVFDSLVNPLVGIPSIATSIHQISNQMVQTAPTLDVIWPQVKEILTGHRIVIYNASFDRRFFPDQLACAAEIRCAMLEFAAFHRRKYGSKKRRFELIDAAQFVGHRWEGEQHRALADTLACRSVWFHLNGCFPPPTVKIPPRKSDRPIKTVTTKHASQSLNQTICHAALTNYQHPTPEASTRKHDSIGEKDRRTLYWIIGGIILLFLIFRD
jgi:DNA polymerase-3 subunit epsilon